MKNINEVTNEFLLYNFFYKLNNIINSNGRNKYKFDERKSKRRKKGNFK